MRFSPLHLLLLGTALAAPIQDLDDAQKRSATDSLAARGLLSFLPRAPVVPLVPKVPIVKPVKPPPAPVKPVPHDPATPNTPEVDTPGLRPNDPVPGTPSTNDPPAPMVPADTAPVVPADPAPVNPADPAPVNPADPAPVNPADPAPVNPADPAPVNPADPAPVNPAEPNPVKPIDDPEAPTTKPDDTTPIDKSNEPDTLPDSPACMLGKRDALGKRAPNCVAAPKNLVVKPDSKWATSGTERYRQEGHQVVAEADQAIAAGGPDTGFKGSADVPIGQKKDNVMTENGRYKADAENDPMSVTDAPYVKGKPGFDMSDMEKWTESNLMPNDQQNAAFVAWQKETRKQLLASGASKKDVDKFMMDEVGEGQTPSLLTTFESPSQNSMVISMSDSRKADLYRPYEYEFQGQKIKRPAFGDESEASFWSDQAPAAYRRTAHAEGKTLADLEWMARDKIVTPETQRVFESVFEQMGAKAGAGSVTVKKGGSGTRTGGIEQASFDAVSRTVHGNGPIRMTRDHHVEMKGKKVIGYEITRGPETPPRWDMIVQFGFE